VRSGHYYTVCEGPAKQMLGHAANIALAISQREAVMIPDVFFTDAEHVSENVSLSQARTIPLHMVFDVGTLMDTITTFGIQSSVVPYDADFHGQLPCSPLEVLEVVDSSVAKAILEAMVPSDAMTSTLDILQSAMVTRLSTQLEPPTEIVNLHAVETTSSFQFTMSNAVCFHHPDGKDWRRFCDQRESLSPEYHNCKNHEPIARLVERRISHLSNAWIFYKGDHEIPEDLRLLNVPVITREQIASSDTELMTALAWTGHTNISPSRDLGAILDYFLCSRMPVFIGNSVSLWSASQIAVRDTDASWYNSFRIPLAQLFKAYTIPFVYTYTEGSLRTGKLLLKVSILSLKKVMPAASIHVLYDGGADTSFRAWLIEHGVVVHTHNPEWRHKLEAMRRAIIANGRNDSHLYANTGSFFGTFQRIDIPEFLSVEYCILLDSDTIVTRPFTIADFGTQLPRGLAISSELNETLELPRNAGVALLNVPFLRESLNTFREFVFNHTSGEFKGGPGDQGAFREFYSKSWQIKFLSSRFNMKPYYRNKSNWDNSYIVHYHGVKPSDEIDYWFSGTCDDSLKCRLITKFRDAPYKCDAMVKFAKAANLEGPGIIKAYCNFALKEHRDHCIDLLFTMAHDDSPGHSCTKYLNAVLMHKGLDPLDFPRIAELSRPHVS